MNASPFIHRNGYTPLIGFIPKFPSWPTPEAMNTNYAIFKEIEGDKGLRNATKFYWNLKKLSISSSCVLTYAMDDTTKPPTTVTISKSHTAYDPVGGFSNAGPSPTEESEIPQPARNATGQIWNSRVGFTYLDPIDVEPYWKYDQSFSLGFQAESVWFIESLQRWVASVNISGEFAAATWDAGRDHREGFGYVDIYNLRPGQSAPPGYSETGIILPDIFEGGNRLMFRTPYGDSATVTAAVTAEYWTYA